MVLQVKHSGFYQNILDSLKQRKLFSILVDPDKYDQYSLLETGMVAEENAVDFLLVGGSLVSNPVEPTIQVLKQVTTKPVILFPGNILQISPLADGILLLCLISGRNPEYLIGNHVIAAPLLKKSNLEVIPTGYILIENGRSTSVEYISNTKPIPADKVDLAVATAMAGEMLGHKILYLDAGSGADQPVKASLIKDVKKNIDIPLIVGGGIDTPDKVEKIYFAGADIIVIGTAVEKDIRNLKVLCETAREFAS